MNLRGGGGAEIMLESGYWDSEGLVSLRAVHTRPRTQTPLPGFLAQVFLGEKVGSDQSRGTWQALPLGQVYRRDKVYSFISCRILEKILLLLLLLF